MTQPEGVTSVSLINTLTKKPRNLTISVALIALTTISKIAGMECVQVNRKSVCSLFFFKKIVCLLNHKIIYIYIHNIYIHTLKHTHTHTYIYIYNNYEGNAVVSHPTWATLADIFSCI